jgi:hypothetical protein
MLIPLAVAVALTFPALSAQEPEADWLAPSLMRVTGASQEAIPDKASVPAKVTVTFELFHPYPFAGGAAVAVAVGFVKSILMCLTVTASAALPATSAQLPLFVTSCSAPSPDKVDPATVSEAMPD